MANVAKEKSLLVYWFFGLLQHSFAKQNENALVRSLTLLPTSLRTTSLFLFFSQLEACISCLTTDRYPLITDRSLKL